MTHKILHGMNKQRQEKEMKHIEIPNSTIGLFNSKVFFVDSKELQAHQVQRKV